MGSLIGQTKAPEEIVKNESNRRRRRRQKIIIEETCRQRSSARSRNIVLSCLKSLSLSRSLARVRQTESGEGYDYERYDNIEWLDEEDDDDGEECVGLN